MTPDNWPSGDTQSSARASATGISYPRDIDNHVWASAHRRGRSRVREGNTDMEPLRGSGQPASPLPAGSQPRSTRSLRQARIRPLEERSVSATCKGLTMLSNERVVGLAGQRGAVAENSCRRDPAGPTRVVRVGRSPLLATSSSTSGERRASCDRDSPLDLTTREPARL
jgi:hypothetical protein